MELNTRRSNNNLRTTTAQTSKLYESVNQSVSVPPNVAKSRLFLKILGAISGSNEKAKECLKAMGDKINSLPERIHTIARKVTAELANEARGNREHSTKFAKELTAEVKAMTESVEQDIRELLMHARRQASTCMFKVQGVKALQEKATISGEADFDSEKMYLPGCCISSVIGLEKRGESLVLRGCRILYRGDMDDIVQWQLQHKINRKVLHPKDGSQRAQEVRLTPIKNLFQKPAGQCNRVEAFDCHPLNFNELVNDGYVENDMLWVKFELLP